MADMDVQDGVTVEMLEEFGDAWDRHDVDKIMSFFAEDCTFVAGWGAVFRGQEEVREGVQQFFQRFPDGHFSDAKHFVCGDRGVSEWRFRATGSEGRRLDMVGCDVFTFKGNKIAVKDAFRKDRPT